MYKDTKARTTSVFGMAKVSLLKRSCLLYLSQVRLFWGGFGFVTLLVRSLDSRGTYSRRLSPRKIASDKCGGFCVRSLSGIKLVTMQNARPPCPNTFREPLVRESRAGMDSGVPVDEEQWPREITTRVSAQGKCDARANRGWEPYDTGRSFEASSGKGGLTIQPRDNGS